MEETEKELTSKVNINVQSLSDLERAIYLDYGPEGVMIFRMANKEMTIEEMTKELGIDEKKVEDIIEKMKGRYIYVEEKEEQKHIEEVKEKEKIYIDVPKKAPLDNISSVALVSELTLKFGPTAKKIYEMIDGKLDVIEIAASNLIGLAYVDNLMWFLAEKRAATFIRLDENDIKRKYGSIGLKIFNQYGREGLFLYLLLDKTADPIAALKYSELEPGIGVEAMDYILKVIDAPITFNKKDALTILKR